MVFQCLIRTGLTPVPHRFLSLRLVAIQLIFLLALAVPDAFATRVECEKALLAVQASLGEAPKTDSYTNERNQRPSVMIGEIVPGNHGGKLIHLHKTASRWLSDYTTVEYDFQGDPRWFIELMGAEAAEFFGFKLLSDDHVTVPDGPEFNGALAKINAQMKAMDEVPVEITFYQTNDNENTKVAEYVRRFGFDNGIPLALSGNHLLHDLSFHTGAIFIPSSLIRHSAYLARFLDGFLESLAVKFANDPAKMASLKHIAFLMRMNHTIAIDTATGTVSPGTISSLRQPGNREALELLFAPTAILAGHGDTPRMYFVKKIMALDPSTEHFLNEYSGLSRSAKTDEALKAVSIAELLKLLGEFDDSNQVEGSAIFAKSYFPMNESTVEELCKQYGLRRILVRRAALALIGKK